MTQGTKCRGDTRGWLILCLTEVGLAMGFALDSDMGLEVSQGLKCACAVWLVFYLLVIQQEKRMPRVTAVPAAQAPNRRAWSPAQLTGGLKQRHTGETRLHRLSQSRSMPMTLRVSACCCGPLSFRVMCHAALRRKQPPKDPLWQRTAGSSLWWAEG